MFSQIQQINRFIHQSMLIKAEKQVTLVKSALMDKVRAALSYMETGPTESSIRKVNEIRAQQHIASHWR